mmetsp:Transcript_21059/g.68155  ORF Transcript_21059/g.68155 Transcript_21059/m.68155 type:complete len:227 (-) Transcript_21059:405-1085(-)
MPFSDTVARYTPPRASIFAGDHSAEAPPASVVARSHAAFTSSSVRSGDCRARAGGRTAKRTTFTGKKGTPTVKKRVSGLVFLLSFSAKASAFRRSGEPSSPLKRLTTTAPPRSGSSADPHASRKLSLASSRGTFPSRSYPSRKMHEKPWARPRARRAATLRMTAAASATATSNRPCGGGAPKHPTSSSAERSSTKSLSPSAVLPTRITAGSISATDTRARGWASAI